METTFITIHDLSSDARILYTSDSIVDVLGYSPEDVVNHSCWDYFHPEELPLAKAKHDHGVALDKAAMLNYCRMKDKQGNYVGCEVVFTVVYDVLVGCTSVYRRGLKSHKRATEAPVVRRLFSTSPRDPRYHMLSHLSSKFAAPSPSQDHEPRAALFLNRYTRTLTIMYATNGLSEILGMTGEEMKGKSFYYCIQENCLQDAIRCLENAKSNDSIAYLRFWFRDPRQDTSPDEYEYQAAAGALGQPTRNVGRNLNNDNFIGGRSETLRQGAEQRARYDTTDRRVAPESHPVPALERRSASSADSRAVSSGSSVEPMDTSGQNLVAPADSRGSSGDSNQFTHEAVFGDAPSYGSSTSSISPSSTGRYEPIELEAVVSCTSDGLVVCLRRAKEGTPLSALQPPQPSYENGLFAVPWASNPILPPISQTDQANSPLNAASAAFTGQAPQVSASRGSGPPTGSDFMNSIRDIAIFAWALVGINGSLAEYSSGNPRGESQPAAGLPIWQPDPDRERAMVSSNRHRESGKTNVEAQNSWNTSFAMNPFNGAFNSGGNNMSMSSVPSQFGHSPNPQPLSWTSSQPPNHQNPAFRQPFQHH